MKKISVEMQLHGLMIKQDGNGPQIRQIHVLFLQSNLLYKNLVDETISTTAIFKSSNLYSSCTPIFYDPT